MIYNRSLNLASLATGLDTDLAVGTGWIACLLWVSVAVLGQLLIAYWAIILIFKHILV